MLTLEFLKNILSYDPLTGIFRWKRRSTKYSARVNIGSIAGSIHNSGHREISIKSKLYKAHRLAWFYIYGVWPRSWIDHKNGIRDDNRIENLRECTPSQNSCNSRGWAKRKSPYKGVYPQKKRWQAAIRKDRKLIYLGSFETPWEAHKAYIKAAKELSGEFARGG